MSVRHSQLTETIAQSTMLAPPYQLPYPGVLGVHGLDGKLPRHSSTLDGFRALSFTLPLVIYVECLL